MLFKRQITDINNRRVSHKKTIKLSNKHHKVVIIDVEKNKVEKHKKTYLNRIKNHKKNTIIKKHHKTLSVYDKVEKPNSSVPIKERTFVNKRSFTKKAKHKMEIKKHKVKTVDTTSLMVNEKPTQRTLLVKKSLIHKKENKVKTKNGLMIENKKVIPVIDTSPAFIEAINNVKPPAYKPRTNRKKEPNVLTKTIEVVKKHPVESAIAGGGILMALLML